MPTLYRIIATIQQDPPIYMTFIRTGRSEPPAPYAEVIEGYDRLDDPEACVPGARATAEAWIRECFTADEALELFHYLIHIGLDSMHLERASPLYSVMETDPTSDRLRISYPSPIQERTVSAGWKTVPIEHVPGLTFGVSLALPPPFVPVEESTSPLGLDPSPSGFTIRNPGPFAPEVSEDSFLRIFCLNRADLIH